MTRILLLSAPLGRLLLGLPIAFAQLLRAMARMVQTDLFSDNILAQSHLNGVDSFPLLDILVFLVAGEVMSTGRVSTRILRLASAQLGAHRGGLSNVAIFPRSCEPASPALPSPMPQPWSRSSTR